MKLMLPILILAVCSAGVEWYLYRKNRQVEDSTPYAQEEHQNPLEFKTAFLFAFLFVFFAALTHYVLIYYGNGGLQSLSFIAGVTDIAPFC
jgi:uncharacterized membrane protein (DUF4010 family)